MVWHLQQADIWGGSGGGGASSSTYFGLHPLLVGIMHDAVPHEALLQCRKEKPTSETLGSGLEVAQWLEHVPLSKRPGVSAHMTAHNHLHAGSTN